MKKLFSGVLFMMLFANVAHAGFLDDLRNQLPESTKAKEMVRVDLPVNAIRKNDKRIKRIESLAVQVAMKKNWVIRVACMNDAYCKGIKHAVDKEALTIARSKTHSKFEAESKMPKIKMVRASGYSLRLWRKGL